MRGGGTSPEGARTLEEMLVVKARGVIKFPILRFKRTACNYVHGDAVPNAAVQEINMKLCSW